MSDQSLAERMSVNGAPPTAGGARDGTATTSTTAAASLDLGVLKGTARAIAFQPRGGDVFVRFGASVTTGTTSGDTSNGVKLVDGAIRVFVLTENTRYCDHICSAASKALFWWPLEAAQPVRP